MSIELWLKNTAEPRRYDAANTYEEGSFLCIQTKNEIVKYPVSDVWRVVQKEDKQ